MILLRAVPMGVSVRCGKEVTRTDWSRFKRKAEMRIFRRYRQGGEATV